MQLISIAFGNLKRRKLKMTLLVLGLVIGVGSISGLYSITRAMEEDLANKIDAYGSNIIIVPDDESRSISFGGVAVPGVGLAMDLDNSMIDQMKTIKNKDTLNIISPKLLADELINDHQALLLGVQFEEELRLKRWWKINWSDAKKIPATDEILIGSDAARILRLENGSELTIRGKQFRVTGIISPTGSSEDDEAIFVDLTTLQNLLGKPHAISLIEVAAFCYTCPIFEVTQQLQEKLPGTKVSALKESVQNRDVTVKKFAAFARLVSGIIMSIGILVVIISMLSSVRERKREIGVFRAIGYRKSHITRIIFAEAAILSLIGGVLGYLLGMSTATVFGKFVAHMDVKIVWDPWFALYVILGSVAIGVLASSLAALQAATLDPVEALRSM